MSSKNTPSKEQDTIRVEMFEAFMRAANKLKLDVDRDFLETIVRRLEREIYNATTRDCEMAYTERSWANPKFVSIYSVHCYKLLANIDPMSSVGGTHIAELILRGEVSPLAACYYSSQDMNPQSSQAERNIIETRQQQCVERKFTDKYKCKKCGANKATFREYQAGGGDEISTFKYECLECGHIW